VKGDKSSKSFFFSWQTGDVLVIAIRPDDKVMLERSLAGKGALATKSKMAARLAKTNPENALTVVWSKSTPIEKKTVKGGDFSLAVGGGGVTLTANAEMASSAEADDIVKMGKQVSTFIPKGAPKELDRIAKTLVITSSGTDVKVTLSGSEKDVISMLQQGLKKKKS